jgi:small-conductance mechanosensitive channel
VRTGRNEELFHLTNRHPLSLQWFIIQASAIAQVIYMRSVFTALAIPILVSLSLSALAQSDDPIEAAPTSKTDKQIAQRIQEIYAELGELSEVVAEVDAGVVTLSGDAPNAAAAERAVSLSQRVQGVVTVEDNISRTLAIQDNVQPLLQDIADSARNALRALPLYFIAFLIFMIVAYIGHSLARWRSLWNRLGSNRFLADLMAQAVRVTGIVLGIVIALNIIGANALIGTVLGSAGVLGLAVGFAVRDTLENYLASIMLSLRQPFRAADHVLINDSEGIVMRLTSRATILMTLDGNHLRIPNSDVYKAIIQNFSTNPQRRMTFELGVDAEDDPVAAIDAGLSRLSALDFVLDDPPATAVIKDVGDSNIVISFRAWIDQLTTDFAKARSLAIRETMRFLEDEGFTMPEPIYRLRFDNLPAELTATDVSTQREIESTKGTEPSPSQPTAVASDELLMDTTPDEHIRQKVDAERQSDDHEDLLNQSAPVE